MAVGGQYQGQQGNWKELCFEVLSAGLGWKEGLEEPIPVGNQAQDMKGGHWSRKPSPHWPAMAQAMQGKGGEEGEGGKGARPPGPQALSLSTDSAHPLTGLADEETGSERACQVLLTGRELRGHRLTPGSRQPQVLLYKCWGWGNSGIFFI